MQTVVRSVVLAAKAARGRVNARVARRVGAGRMMPVLSAKMMSLPSGIRTVATNVKTAYNATKRALFVRSASLDSFHKGEVVINAAKANSLTGL